MKFYYSKNSNYETCKIGSIRLIPQIEDINNIREDYERMKGMIFGEIPSFEEIIEVIKKLENEINSI